MHQTYPESLSQEAIYGPSENAQLPPEVMAQYGITPEQAAQLSPEAATGILDSYGQQQMNSAAANFDAQLDALRGGTLQMSSEALQRSEQEAKVTLSGALENALERSSEAGEAGIRSLETAAHDKQVEDAKAAIDKAFSGIVADPELDALKKSAFSEVVADHQLIDKNADKVVDQVLAGDDPLQNKVPEPFVPVGEKVMIDGKLTKITSEVAIDARDEAKDVHGRNNGMTGRFVRNMTTRIDSRLDSLGVKNKLGNFKRRQQLVALQMAPEGSMVNRSGGAKELDVTQNGRESWTEDRIIGEDFVRAFATGERMNGAKKKEIIAELQKNPAEAVEIAAAISRLRSTNEVSRRTANKVGRLLRKAA